MLDGCIKDALLVLDISTNLLSIYHICHSGDGNSVEFTPHNVTIRQLQDPEKVVAIGIVDYENHLYQFHGVDSSTSSSFIAHVDSVRKHWHERFGHLNYRYLQQMHTHNLVVGLPKMSCIDNIYQGCVLGKQH